MSNLAELIAIIEAIKYAKYANNTEFLIISDCKSVLQKIQNLKTGLSSNYLFSVLSVLLREINSLRKKIHLLWVKSHCGIVHNEYVDELAKKAIVEGESAEYLCPAEDLFGIAKTISMQLWSLQYSNELKGKYYRDIQPILPKQPWFKDCYYEKKIVTTISRLRFNHALTPIYKYKLDMIDSPSCVCGELGDSEHIILGCTNYQNQIDDFCRKLTTITTLQQPVCLTQILISNDLKIYKLLEEHICSLGIRL